MNRQRNTGACWWASRSSPVLSLGTETTWKEPSSNSVYFCFLKLNLDAHITCHFDGRCAIYFRICNKKKCNAAKKGQFHRCLSFSMIFFFSFLDWTVWVQKWITAITPWLPRLSFLFDPWYLINKIWHVYCYKLPFFLFIINVDTSW